MKDNEIILHNIEGFDHKKFKEVFLKWFDNFQENVLEEEFEGGKSEIEETPEKLTFLFTSQWKVTVEKENKLKDKE